MISVFRYWRSDACIGIILASSIFPAALRAQEPPPDLAKRVADRATRAHSERDNYVYRQSVTFEELGDKGQRLGEYREVREVIFTPGRERTEEMVGRPLLTLRRLRLTEEDFRDMREIQPFLFSSEHLWAYETRYRGEERVDNVDCYLLQVRPRQILAGQRLFDGLLWVNKQDFSIVRSEGQAVPQIRSMSRENLFPHFTTLWKQVDGGHWFPFHTHADDTLDFRTGPQRVRLTIRYSDYKRFEAESTVKFGDQAKPQ